jgi:2-C-methyl-D-erythritol 4-phosphate cytidylyltransferase/2-C-methyl-D-erythritol 2,4-cyclodiphosphate synthase
LSFASIIVAAAGEGKRLRAGVRKAHVPILGRTLLDWSLDLFAPLSEVAEIVVALHPDDVEGEGGQRWLERLRSRKVTAVVAGGATRAESVRRALASVAETSEVVAVHDAARPMTPSAVVRLVLATARSTGAAIAAAPVTDTLKSVSLDGFVTGTVSREGLAGAQTPQAFSADLLRRAYREASGAAFATDDAAIVESIGVRVTVVPCAEPNLKVTTAADIATAEALLSSSSGGVRVGLGQDLHRLEPGDALVIGGVAIPSDRRAVGHSDADVLLHALTDAVLGAAGLTDIGTLFPDTDPAWRGARSDRFVREALALARTCGLRVAQADAVVTLESPKLSPHREIIRASLSAILGLDPSRIGLKFKTSEGLGPVGERRAIAADAVVLLAGFGGGRAA